MKKYMFFLLIVAMAIPGSLAAEEKTSGKIAIIVSQEWKGLNSVTLSDLSRMYLKQMSNFAGAEVKPVHRKADSGIRQAFIKKVMNMDESDLKNYWLKQNLTGQESPPKSFDSFSAVVVFVKKQTGAIGYVEHSSLDETALKEVKVIPIEKGGKPTLPGDEGYDLTF